MVQVENMDVRWVISTPFFIGLGPIRIWNSVDKVNCDQNGVGRKRRGALIAP